jgi:PhnB protein
MKANPYLFFDGSCAEALARYAALLGGKVMTMPYRGMPAEQGTPQDWLDKVMHGQVDYPGGVIMGSDPPPAWFQPMQGSAVHLGVGTEAEAERVFAALAEGGSIGMPMEETFWAKRFGMCVDRWGVKWMVNCPKPM